MLSNSFDSPAGEQMRDAVFFKIKFVPNVERHVGVRQRCQHTAGFAGQAEFDSHAFSFQFPVEQLSIGVDDLQSRRETQPLFCLRTVKQ